MLGLLIARRTWATDGWIDYRGRRRHDRLEERLRKLGLGLLVHDVGKLAVPPEILNKPGRLSDDEMGVMKTHAHAGVELLRPADLSPIAISVVRDHHERIDGSGYPEGLLGTQVQEFPRIAAVADVYDAVTSERVYKPAAPPHVGVRVIRDGTGSQFCPAIVRHFRAVVMPYPVGHEITLPDGRTAVVASVDIDSPDVPTVRVRASAGVEEFTIDMTASAATSAAAALRPRLHAHAPRPATRVRVVRLRLHDRLEAERRAPGDRAEPVAIAEPPAAIRGHGLDRDRPPPAERIDRHLRPELPRPSEQPAAERGHAAVAHASRRDGEASPAPGR